MFFVSLYLRWEPHGTSTSDLIGVVRGNGIYVLLYFTGIFGFYYLLERTGFTSGNVCVYCFIFLLISPTIKSSTILVTDTDSYHPPVFETAMPINPGTPYNKLSTFSSSLLDLLAIKKATRFEQTHYDRYDYTIDRIGALRYSNSYQLHFYSVIINLLLFIFLFVVFRRREKRGTAI